MKITIETRINYTPGAGYSVTVVAERSDGRTLTAGSRASTRELAEQEARQAADRLTAMLEEEEE